MEGQCFEQLLINSGDSLLALSVGIDLYHKYANLFDPSSGVSDRKVGLSPVARVRPLWQTCNDLDGGNYFSFIEHRVNRGFYFYCCIAGDVVNRFTDVILRWDAIHHCESLVNE